MTEEAAGVSRRRVGAMVLAAAAVLVVAFGVWWVFGRTSGESVRGLGDYDFATPGKLYFGRAALSQRPAVVDSSAVYRAISEYQQILQEGLKDDVPRYHFLMVQASHRFSRAVAAAARAGGFDAVAEAGTVRSLRQGALVPPDITSAVLAQLK